MRDERPEPVSELDREGVPDMEEPYPGEAATGVRWDGVVAPAEAPAGVEERGTTASEGRAGEPVADRVRREEPEAGAAAGLEGEAAGGPARLVGADRGGTVDDEPDAVADGVVDGGALSPEEAAVRVTSEHDAPGLTFDAGPGYLDEEPPA